MPIDLSSLVQQVGDRSGFLRLLTTTALQAAPGAQAASLRFSRSDRDLTVASVGDLAQAGDERRYGLDDGPSATALREGVVVAIDDMAAETRWGRYPVVVSQAGVGSALCVPLHTRQEVGGVLTFYARSAHALGDGDLAAARSWASQAASALVLARWLHERDAEVQQLRTGMQSSQLIGQATGLDMAQVNCTSAVAVQALRKQSSTSNTKLRAIAGRLVADHDNRASLEEP